ncbi:MAG: hypothetical protein Q8N21_03060 [bacterium]|nr:hypothetical protein [bacterium]
MYKKITKPFDYKFSIKQSGFCSISISASCRSGAILGLFGGEDLRAEIDEIKLREIPAKDKPQYKDIPSTWNGAQLNGLSKTVIFISYLEQGDHIIKFVPYRGAIIEKEPEITLIQDIKNIEFKMAEQAQDGNRRPWITLALIDLPLNLIDASVKCEKRFLDSDDAGLIIDGQTQKNKRSGQWGKNWYWQGRQLCGNTEEARFYPKLDRGTHYVEFWADRQPTLHWVKINLGKTEDTNNKIIIQQYIYKGINGKEDYNRFDKEIREVVDYWNNVFAEQEYPPQEFLDCNLVKAIVYKESRAGYFAGGEIDVMQVGNPGDPALKTLNGELEEWELINGKLEQLNYRGEASVKTPRDSIYWGVRWLYHKAQEITHDKQRSWRGWKEAVFGYGPGVDEYVDDVWKIYKTGIDANGNNLWKKDENGFSTTCALIAIAVILVAGIIGWYVGAKMHVNCYSQKKQADNFFSLKTADRAMKEVFLKDLENYKQGGSNNGYFADTLKECEKLNCVRQSIFYENYQSLVENMRDNKHFLVAVNSLGITDAFNFIDIDNDGENEIIFSLYNPLNRDFVALSVIDKVDNKFKAIEKRINYGHGSHIAIMDLTGDLIPEIAFFVSFGKGGDSLFVYQYKNREIAEIFNNQDFDYAEYTFSDINLNNRMEIKIEGEEREAAGKQRRKIYEYDERGNEFIIAP